jgi:hypothetical protein
VAIVSTYRTEYPGFESRQGVRFFDLNALQCRNQNLIHLSEVKKRKKIIGTWCSSLLSTLTLARKRLATTEWMFTLKMKF